MNRELDRQLVEKYPLIFRDRHEDMSKTAMCWGFACGDGWFNIIDCLCASIQSHIDNVESSIEWTKKWNKNVLDTEYEWKALVPRELRAVPHRVPQVVATQIKEKFGGLRFYYSGGDAITDGMVNMAENLSYKTCETCGSPGELVTEGGWYYTACEKHKR